MPTIVKTPFKMPRSPNSSAAVMISSVLLLLLSTSGDAFSPVFATATLGSRAVSTSSALKLSESEVIDLAKDYVEKRNGFYAPIDGNVHSEDFVFRAGIVGPLNKVDYIDTMTKLGIANAFDVQPNAFGFCVDPDQPPGRKRPSLPLSGSCYRSTLRLNRWWL